MTNSKWLFMVWLAGALCGACGRADETARTEASPVAEATWLTNFETAQERARSEKKLLLIEFTGSDWCPPCIMLGRQVFSQPEFKNYAAQHLVLLEVDFPRMKELSAEQKTANEKLAERFGIYGFPTVVLLDPSGNKIGELGYMPGGPKAFIAAVEKLRGKG
ncbi:MAG TPA: thioredoxin family protein [Chthoniobacteraceae bacterium]|nr:thioredoxin family protein [Chthoniobacteraceae bacterium]